ncbi:hypothetical protein [Streptomyces sp. NPDC001070]
MEKPQTLARPPAGIGETAGTYAIKNLFLFMGYAYLHERRSTGAQGGGSARTV